MKFAKILLLFYFSTSSFVSAVEPGYWAMFFNQTRISNKWSIHTEVQFRNATFRPNTEQVLYRVGINYHFKPDVLFTAGFAEVPNYAFQEGFAKPPSSNEHRVWQQVLLRNNYGRFFIEHRYRVEQRWLLSAQQNTYKNRMRYMLRVSVPINKKQIQKNTLFLVASDEVFLHLNSNPYDRNRIYVATGFQIATGANLQLGFLWQTTASNTRKYAQVALNYNLDFRKEEKK